MKPSDFEDPVLKQMQEAADKLTSMVNEHRANTAATLFGFGVTLIPCDHLKDHQFIVSRDIYDAAVRICEQEQKEGE